MTPLAVNKPTLAKVLGELPADRKAAMFHYAQRSGFHRGRQWFGAGMRVVKDSDTGSALLLASAVDMACPVAAAYDVAPDYSETGWFSARLDQNLLSAIKHIVETAGGEDGMEQYLKELENTSPFDLQDFVEIQYYHMQERS